MKEFSKAEEALKKKEVKKGLRTLPQKEKAVAIIKRNHSNEVKAWGKLHEDATKGSSWYWKTTIEIMKGFVCTLWLTGIMDSKIC